MRKLIICALTSFTVLQLNAKEMPLSHLFLAKPILLSQPAFSDSKNAHGKTFDEKQFMSYGLQTDGMALVDDHLIQNGKEVSAQWETKGIANNSLEIRSVTKEAPQLGHAMFFVENPSFTKGTLKVKYPYFMEIYIDGAKVAERLSEEKDSSKTLDAEMKLNPKSHQVIIKYMVPKWLNGNYKMDISLDIPDNKTVLLNESKRPFTINDVLEGDKVASASISPTGDYAKVTFSKVNTRTGDINYHHKVYSTKDNKEIFLPEKAASANWMEKGNRLWWIDKINGNTLIVFDLDNNSMRVVAFNMNPKGDYAWAPDETFLIVSIPEEKIEEKGPMIRILSPEDRQPYWRDRSLLYKYDISSGATTQLTFGNKTTHLVGFSPDSKYAYIGVSEDKYTERPFSVSHVYKIYLSDNSADTIWKDQKFINDIKLSPDGKLLLVSGGPEAFDKIGLNLKDSPIANSYDNQLFLFDLSSRKATALTKNFDPSIDDMQWLGDSKNLIVTVTEKDRNQMYKYSIPNGIFSKLASEIDIVNGASAAKYGSNLVYYGQHYNYPTRAFTYNLKTNESRLLADPSALRIKEIRLGDMEDWNFTAKDGSVIEGRIYLPPHFDPNKKYPLIVNYYGGTTPSERNFESRYPLHLYATMGYVVYVMQPSGTIGYGQEFSARHVNAWGKKTADEIIEGTKQLMKEHSYIDASKVGCIGASYGGFMTLYLQTKTDIFATAISHAGISDITSYWGEGYWGYTYSAGASADSYPWNNKNLYINQSPLFSADKINTPILFLHGQEDTNVPIGESIQMYTALKVLGKPCEFITVEKQNHTITGYKQRIAWNNTIFAWFAKYLQNDSSWWNDLYPENNL